MLSKEQEKNLLVQFRDSVLDQDAGAYLGSLISQKLIAWFESQMRIDFSCDIMDYVESLIADRDAYAGRCDTLRNEIAAVERAASLEREKLESKLHEAEHDLTRKDGRIENWRKTYAFMVEERNQLTNRAGELAKENMDLSTRVDALELEVLELKAKMFDMMTGNE